MLNMYILVDYQGDFEWNKNADYGVDQIAKYCNSSATSGLHKSSTSMSYVDEMKSLPIKCIANRNHFLRFELPHHWHALDDSGIAIDASLGFAEHHGFRNFTAIFSGPTITKQKVHSNICRFHCI